MNTWTKNDITDAVKTINAYSDEKVYPLKAQIDTRGGATNFGFTVYYPTKLGSRWYMSFDFYEDSGLVGSYGEAEGRKYLVQDPDAPYGLDGWVMPQKNFWSWISKMKKKSDKQMLSDKVFTKNKSGKILVYEGLRRIGEVWKGRDKRWYHSEMPVEAVGYGSKKEAIEQLLLDPSKRTMVFQDWSHARKSSGTITAKQLLQEVREIKKQAQDKKSSNKALTQIARKIEKGLPSATANPRIVRQSGSQNNINLYLGSDEKGKELYVQIIFDPDYRGDYSYYLLRHDPQEGGHTIASELFYDEKDVARAIISHAKRYDVL